MKLRRDTLLSDTLLTVRPAPTITMQDDFICLTFPCPQKVEYAFHDGSSAREAIADTNSIYSMPSYLGIWYCPQ